MLMLGTTKPTNGMDLAYDIILFRLKISVQSIKLTCQDLIVRYNIY